MKTVAKALAAVAIIGVALTGLYFKSEYSGWVLFIGAVVALGLSDD